MDRLEFTERKHKQLHEQFPVLAGLNLSPAVIEQVAPALDKLVSRMTTLEVLNIRCSQAIAERDAEICELRQRVRALETLLADETRVCQGWESEAIRLAKLAAILRGTVPFDGQPVTILNDELGEKGV